MGRLIRLVLWLVVLGAIALAGFAYLGDLGPDQDERRTPVTLPIGPQDG